MPYDSIDEERADARTRRELARGTLELAVLSVLATRPHYGYELLTEIKGAAGDAPEVKEGTLYPVLHRLEDAGFVVARWDAEGRSQPRKYYELSEAGDRQRRALRSEWDRLVKGMQELMDRWEVGL